MKILTFGKGNIGKFFKRNKHLLIFTAVFIMFFCIGSLYIKASGETIFSVFSSVFDNFLNDRKSNSFWGVLFSSVYIKLIFTIVMFIFGLGAAGVFFSPVMVAVSGIYYGMYVSYIYSAYSLTGIGFCALILLPPLIIFIYSQILAAITSVSFSVLFLGALSKKSALPDLHNSFKIYCGKFLVSAILAVTAALFDALLSKAFINLFKF